MVDAAELILVVFMMVLLTGTSVVVNSSILVAFYRNKHIRTRDNHLIVCLTVSNIAVGLCYPFHSLVNVGILNQKVICLPIACFLILFVMVTACTIIALTFERYFIIVHPFVARRVLTTQCTVGVICFITVYAVLAGAVIPVILSVRPTQADTLSQANSTEDSAAACRFINLFPSRGYRLFYLANRAVSIPVVLGIYLRIFFVARRHMRAIAAQRAQPLPPVGLEQSTAAGSSNTNSNRGYQQKAKANWRRDVKTTLLIFSIAVYQSLCWIPQTVVIFQNHEASSVVYMLTHFFAYSTTAVYSVIYGLGNRDIRQAMATLYGCRRIESSADDVTCTMEVADRSGRHNPSTVNRATQTRDQEEPITPSEGRTTSSMEIGMF